MGDLVRYELDGHVATITYNRPEALNAINGALRGGKGFEVSGGFVGGDCGRQRKILKPLVHVLRVLFGPLLLFIEVRLDDSSGGAASGAVAYRQTETDSTVLDAGSPPRAASGR